ncbi:hypothetical protein RHECNPAF_430060 [Rhizobium etli CNPAF512]|nr:hypothetical protein RHECNPAF_430060 [Rhizobium etli CNPAF512]
MSMILQRHEVIIHFPKRRQSEVLQIAVIGRRYHGDAARLDQIIHCRGESLGIIDMLDHFQADHSIEGAVFSGKLIIARTNIQPQPGVIDIGLGDAIARRIDADDTISLFRKRCGRPARATSEIEDSALRRAGEMALQHPKHSWQDVGMRSCRFGMDIGGRVQLDGHIRPLLQWHGRPYRKIRRKLGKIRQNRMPAKNITCGFAIKILTFARMQGKFGSIDK